MDCPHSLECQECDDEFHGLRVEIEKYRAALADLPCAYSHNEKHDSGCRCADCTKTTENCDCVRCVALCDYDYG